MEKYTTKQDIEFFITQDVSFFLGPKITNPPKIDALLIFIYYLFYFILFIYLFIIILVRKS